MFTCFALAIPQHSVCWTFTNFDGERVDIISTTDASDTLKYLLVHELGNNRFGELTVLDVQFSDRGTYTCSAENSVGSETRAANLTIHGMSVKPFFRMIIYSPVLFICKILSIHFFLCYSYFLIIHSHTSNREELHSWRCQPPSFCHSCLPCHWLPYSKCLMAEEWRGYQLK